APGTYTGVVHLAPGVSLLGSNASNTILEGIDVTSETGSSATLRGVTCGSGGIYAHQANRSSGVDAGTVVVDQVAVKNGTEGGIRSNDVSLTVTATTVTGGGASAYGVLSHCKDSKACVAPAPTV